MARFIESRSKDHVPTRTITTIRRLMRGSTNDQPVTMTIMPPTTTPSETPASAAIWRYAPLMFKSRFCPDAKSNAVIVLITTPTAATTITVIPLIGFGSKNRSMASLVMPPSATSSNVALAKEAIIVTLRKPYVLFIVVGFVARKPAPQASSRLSTSLKLCPASATRAKDPAETP